MIKYFLKAFKITNENIILTTPLVLFLFILTIYLGVAKTAPANIFSLALLLLTILFMLSAFFAGWFYMVKKAIDIDRVEFIIEEEKAKASFGLLKDFPSGIGEFFLPLNGGIILYSILFVAFLFLAYFIGQHYIGDFGLGLDALKNALKSTDAMKSLLGSLSSEQLVKMNAWNFLVMGTTSLFSFITMFWTAEIIYNTKNPFWAFFKSLKFTFKNFLSSLILFVYISFVNFAVSLINALSTSNTILYFISMLIYFYFVVYIIVLVFLYYGSEKTSTVEYYITDETQVDSVKDNCGGGTDSLGQERSGNSDCERD